MKKLWALMFAMACTVFISIALGPATANAQPKCKLSADRTHCTPLPRPTGAVIQLWVNQNDTRPAAVARYLEAVILDLDTKWTKWFLANGLGEPYVKYTIINPGQTATSKCGGGQVVKDDFDNAFYCAADVFPFPGQGNKKGLIVVPVLAFQKMWSGDILHHKTDHGGDFAAASVLAHEFGHHVADEIGTQLNLKPPAVTKRNELLADCFAGNWAASMYQNNQLESGDFDEGVKAITAIGDYEYTNSDHHGTPAERGAAYRSGYSSDPVQCIKSYWPEALK